MKKKLSVWLLWPFAVFFLGVWHLLDVRASVTETGHHWLYGWYGGLFFVSMVVLVGIGIFIFGKNWDFFDSVSSGSGEKLVSKKELVLQKGSGSNAECWKLPGLFFGTVMCLGILYMLVLAPLSAPDEVSHYISAYELSNYFLGLPGTDEDGYIYIRAEDDWVEDVNQEFRDWKEKSKQESLDGENGETNAGKPIILGQTLKEETYVAIHDGGASGKQNAEASADNESAEGSAGTDSSGKTAGLRVSRQPSVRTTPLAYVPQALGFTLARTLGLNSIALLYLGRFFNLLLFAAVGALTIKRLPFGKNVFFGVSILPMSLHLAASLSYDVVILAFTGYFTAVCLDLAYKAETVKVKDVIALAVVMAVMGPCKMVYGAIAGFCLLIPVKKFGNRGKWTISAATVLGSFLAAMAVVNLRTVAMYTQESDSYVAWAEEAGYSFAELIHQPVRVLQLFYNTVAWQGESLYSGILGESLGNRDAVLNTPYVVILMLTACLVLLALKKPGEEIFMKIKDRLWIWFICLVIFAALMFSMLLAWTPKSSNMVQGVQGRYMLPLLPIFLFTLKSKKVVRTTADDRLILYTMVAADVYVILRIFAVVCLRL